MNTKVSILLLGIFLSLTFWIWFLPGPRVASDYPFVSNDSLKSFFDIPRVWFDYGAEGMGEYSVFTIWSWPAVFISATLANLGIGFAIIERVYILLFFILFGSLGLWKIGQSINLSTSARIVSIFFYLTNTYILLVIDGGQLVVGVAYAFFPLSYLAIEKSVKGNVIDKIIAGLTVWILGFFDFRFIYILALLCLLRFIYEFIFLKKEEGLEWIKGWLLTAIIAGFIVVGLNAYWLLPIIKKPLSSSVYSKLIQTSFESFTTLGHSMLLIAPHWFKNIFGKISPLNFEFILVPIFVFLAPILKPKNKTVGFWLIIAVISVFLTKGTSEPFTQLYPWLFHNIPGFSLFRDSTKFFFLVSLSFTILFSITVDEIINKFKNKRIKFLFFLGMMTYLSLLISSAWLGYMTGTFSIPRYQDEYSKLNSVVQGDQDFSRIFWIPSIPPLGSISQNHPSVEAARFVQKRPFAIGTKGTYELFNFLREASYTGELFDVAGIGYIVYPPFDPRRDDLHPDNIRYYSIFSEQLDNLPWIKRVKESSIPLWKTLSSQDKFFIPSNVWWVVGPDDIYYEATTSSKLRLSNNALLFTEESPGFLRRIKEIPEAKIILNNKTETDLAASFIPASNFVFPARVLNYDPDESGWWKRDTQDLLNFRYFLKTKYGIDIKDFDFGGGWAVGEGNLKLKVQREQLKPKKDSILLVRALESSRSGSLSFYQNQQLIGKLETKADKDTNVRWFEVGKLSSDELITISSSGDINVVNAMTIIDPSEWSNYQTEVLHFQDENRIKEFNGAEEQTNTKVTYQKINSTEYKVKVEGLKKEALLILSENYDQSWHINGKSSLPIYGLLNGFRIEKDGEYIVEFTTQKIALLGFLISAVTLVIIIIFVTYKKIKKLKHL